MSKIPPEILEAILANPFYKRCAREIDGGCAGRITFEHAIIYAGKQLQEKWAILPICARHHEVDQYQDNGDLDKARNVHIALSRASGDELKAISKVINYKRELKRLNGIYGIYRTNS